MSTEKLFYNDSFATSFTATVVGCEAQKDYFAIVLDKTLFYPEGGGQPSDQGVLAFGGDKAEIFFVKEKDGVIYHHSYTPIPTGSTVSGTIDFDRRFDLMQQHTGEHILSGIIYKLFGYTNVGFHLSEKDMSIDLSGPLSQQDICRAVELANRIVVENQPVTAGYPDVEKLEYRSKKALEGPIRIVTAGQADICACCGTHLETTGQVQMIAVKDFMNYKGGTRIFFGCGGRVYSDYAQKNADCLKISHLLSAKTDEISCRVSDKIKECEDLKAQLAQAKGELFALWARAVPSGRLGFLQRDGLTGGEIQKLCVELNSRCEIACVVSQQADGSGKICIVSSVADTNSLGRAVCAVLGGKGGGKPGIFQGTVNSLENAQNIVKDIADDR